MQEIGDGGSIVRLGGRAALDRCTVKPGVQRVAQRFLGLRLPHNLQHPLSVRRGPGSLLDTGQRIGNAVIALPFLRLQTEQHFDFTHLKRLEPARLAKLGPEREEVLRRQRLQDDKDIGGEFEDLINALQVADDIRDRAPGTQSAAN